MSDQQVRPTQYLLAISIGPVQDFIAASRKARDLWHGSELLSDISRRVAEYLHQTGQVELIFPTEDAVTNTGGQYDDRVAVANKLLVWVKHGEPAALASSSREAARTLLRDRWSEIWQRLERDIRGILDEPLILDQLEHFIEWYAAWVPYDSSDPDNYKPARERVEQVLAGRKTLRDFNPAHTKANASRMEGRPKSSLDPSRESVILFDKLTRLGETRQRQIRRRLRLKRNEQLDGVSLLKRLGGQNRIVSVSRVAVDPWVRQAHANKPELLASLRAAADTLRDTDLSERFSAGGALEIYKDFPFDCQLFYARKHSEVDTSDLSEDEIKAVDAFLAAMGKLRKDLPPPPTYFAVLLADGDRMGKALGTIDTPDSHQRFSRELARFANEAKSVVQRHHGAMIYSGGDDVLAFLSLDAALPCAFALQKVFTDVMTTAVPDLANDKRPSLSVGLAVGHYSEHLQVLLARARDAERAAKKPRNALAVSFSARSGGGDVRTVTHEWSRFPVRDHWWLAINALRLDAIPDGVVYELDRLQREFAPLENHPRISVLNHQDILYNEVVRIIKRKKVQQGSKPVQTWIFQQIHRRLSARSSLKGQLDELRLLVDELYIARRFLPVVRMGGDPEYLLWADSESGPGVQLEPPPHSNEDIQQENAS